MNRKSLFSRRSIKALLSALAVFLCLFGVSWGESAHIHIEKVPNLPDDFIFGMDVSSVLSEEASGVVYRNFDGNESDLFKVLADSGFNTVRVRVWNHPYDADGHGYGGGNCDTEAAARIGSRAAAHGLRLMVDFHYSDFWADPSKQMPPLAWADMEIDEKSDALYQYTRDSLTRLLAAGADVSLVQIGNETTGRLCGETSWDNICLLMNAGSRACREVCPGALVVLHFTNPEKSGSFEYYAGMLSDHQVDYDVFATSYYPYWHGTLENLSRTLSAVAEKYGKKVMVAETSYAYTLEDSDFYGNTVSSGSTQGCAYAFSPQGQASCLREITDTIVNKTANGIGVVYWEGAWISVGDSSWKENSALWEKYGSGWASSYAGAYDPADAGRYYGGCAVDNQALFDQYGYPLESLRAFLMMR